MGSISTGSLPTSDTTRLRFLDLSGVAIGGPSEWAPALIEMLVSTSAWEDVRLWRQEQELPISLRRISGQVRVVAEWPRSGTGHYRLRLEWRELVEEKVLTIVPQKISLDAYQRLLDDLTTRLPAAVALGLQRLGALAGIKLLPPEETTLTAELVRLRRAVVGTPARPGLTQVLLALSRDPHQMLRAREVWVPERSARRPHPSRLTLALMRGPHGEDVQDRRPILDMQVEHTPDVYENRLVKAYAYQVQLRLRRLMRALEVGRQAALLAEAQGLLRQLQVALRQAAFLEEVSLLAHLPTQLTMVLLERPPYRAALEGYLELHRSAAVRLEEPAQERAFGTAPSTLPTVGHT